MKKVIIFVFTIILIAAIGLFFGSTFNDQDYVVTVTRVERANYSGEGKYLIFCEEENGEVIVFENTDSWIRGKFKSSDMYAKIKEGHTYKFTVIGWRLPIVDGYQNIINMEEVR